MSKEMNQLERIIRILTDNEVRIKEIYETLEMDRIDFYNLRRSPSAKRKNEVAQILSEKFSDIINKVSTQTESESDLQNELIQTLKRENELLRLLNERELAHIRQELAEIKKRFPE